MKIRTVKKWEKGEKDEKGRKEGGGKKEEGSGRKGGQHSNTSNKDYLGL
jgi:hypothetical protein